MEPQPYVLMPRTPAAVVEDQLVRLFKRCVQCPTNQTPVCDCAAGQTCSLFPGDCWNCAYTSCSGTATSTGPNVAAIAGGVVGGIVALGLIGVLIWLLRKRKHQEYLDEDQFEPEEWDNAEIQHEKDDHDRYSSRLNARASTHTMASMSSNVSGRASNIIQIAYIPGVTNRSHSTPDLIPPVPPIPAASGGSSRASQADQLLFLPGDLRQSTYSEYSNRDSVAASRNSVASTIYRNDAIVNPMPAQAVNLLKPMAVSVKTSNKGSPTISRPATPPQELPSRSSSTHQQLNTKSSIVGKFAQPRAITVTRKNSHSLKPHGHKAFELDGSDHSVSSVTTSMHQRSGPGSPSHSNAASTFNYNSDDEDEGGQSSRLVELPASKTPTAAKSNNPIYSRPSELAGSSTTELRDSGISRAIQDSMVKAMQTHMGTPRTPPELSPFSDVHETKTP